VFTFAGEWGRRLANAASNTGRPGAGMFHASYNCADSRSQSALPNAYRNCAAVSETDRFRFAGLPKTGNAARSCAGGSTSTPLIGAGSIATAAAARSWPSRLWAIRPPNECP